jgi:hypothetical protein
MCSSDAGGSSFCYSFPDRDVVRRLGLGCALAEPHTTFAGVTFDPNADNRGSCFVRKCYGLHELVAKKYFA